MIGRPPKTNRGAVRDITITLKMSASEHKKLHALAADRAREIEELTGQKMEPNVSSYVRWLIDRDALARAAKRKAAE